MRSARRPSPATILAAALLVVAIACASVVLIAKATGTVANDSGNSGGGPQRFLSGMSLYTDPDSPAARAIAAEPSMATAFAPLAATPTGIWLTPERQSIATVGEYVAAIAAAAASESRVPTFVVYGIPNRDCGSESAGGLTTAEYPGWVSAIAAGIGDHSSIVILEPDSLALSAQCGQQEARIALVADAAARFDGTGAQVYLDGGHSDWLGASAMAGLLTRAKVSSVRGFATNVSNYNDISSERSYADEVSRLTGGAHYVVDVSRNGAGSNGEWCNPTGRRLGDRPAIETTGGAHDADLWIKPPGESDGTCNGGPAAGQWWDHSALELLGETG